MDTKKNSHLGRKILYSIVIAMSGLILLLCAVGLIGIWLVQRPISDAAVTVFGVVENSAKVMRAATGRIDRPLAALEAKTTEISDASEQISQNVTDKGLILVLLPEEKENQLVESAGSVKDTYTSTRESIARGLDLYRSINRMPFVSLPGPSADQMDRIESSVTRTQALVETLRSEIGNFRSGVSGSIDKVTGAAGRLTGEITSVRNDLAQLDSSLAALEALSIHMQQVIPGILVTVAVILSLLFAFVIFTQVEVILLYIARWRLLGQPQAALPAETPA
jgi:uncharacterized protein YukE